MLAEEAVFSTIHENERARLAAGPSSFDTAKEVMRVSDGENMLEAIASRLEPIGYTVYLEHSPGTQVGS